MDIGHASMKLFAAKAANSAVMFLGLVIFSRKIGAAAIGTYFLFEAVLALLALPADLGIRRAVEKRISEGVASGEHLTTGLLLKVIPLSIVVIMIIVFSNYVDQYLSPGLAGLLILALCIREGTLFVFHILKGELRVAETAVLEFARRFIWFVLGYILLELGFGVRGIIYGLLVGLALALALGTYKISIPLMTPSVASVNSLFSFAKFNIVAQTAGEVYGWMDIFFIGLFLTTIEVGAYEAAWRVATFVLIFSHAITTAAFPQVSSWSAAEKYEKLEELFPTLIVPSVFLVFPSFVGVLLLADEILGLLFGSEFTVAATAMVILTFEKMLQAAHMLIGRFLNAIDRPDLPARTALIAVVLNVILNVTLIPVFGLVGAALATGIAFSVNSLINMYYLQTFIELQLPTAKIARLLGASLAMGGVVSLISFIIDISSLPKLFLVVGTGGVTYVTLAFATESIREEMIPFLPSSILKFLDVT